MAMQPGRGLIATGFSPDVLLIRDARESGWSDGLEQAASVICDSA